MNDQRVNPIQNADSFSNLEKLDTELFSRIKTTQSLPDEVVHQFLKSKGKLINKIDILDQKANEK